MAQLRPGPAPPPPATIFVFPDAGHALDPGIFRCDALRAVYVDWKGGGQVNFFREFGEQWWFRWRQEAVTAASSLPTCRATMLRRPQRGAPPPPAPISTPSLQPAAAR